MKNLIIALTIISMMSCATQKEYALQWKDPKTNELITSRPVSDSLKTAKHAIWLNKKCPNINHVAVKLKKK